MSVWLEKRCEPLPGVMNRKDTSRHCTRSRGLASSERWTQVRASGSSPWCVVRRYRAWRGGA
jgi:hypothetical protein